MVTGEQSLNSLNMYADEFEAKYKHDIEWWAKHGETMLKNTKKRPVQKVKKQLTEAEKRKAKFDKI